MQTGFLIGNTLLPYFGNHPHNDPGSNERAIELPLAGHFMRTCGTEKDFIEIGEVTPFYTNSPHMVVDLNPQKPETVRQNIFDLDLRGKNVLSISTVEHVGTADYAPIGDTQAIEQDGGWKALQKIRAESNRHLVTFPVGWNLALDALVRTNLAQEDYRILLRVHKNNVWMEDSARRFSYRYGYPFPHANAICVVTNIGF